MNEWQNRNKDMKEMRINRIRSDVKKIVRKIRETRTRK
jgi:hypothetical protein